MQEGQGGMPPCPSGSAGPGCLKMSNKECIKNNQEANVLFTPKKPWFGRFIFQTRKSFHKWLDIVGWTNLLLCEKTSQSAFYSYLTWVGAKGQIISEQNCGVLNFPKKQRNYLRLYFFDLIHFRGQSRNLYINFGVFLEN